MLGSRVVQQLMSGNDRVQLGADVRHLDTDYSPGWRAVKHYNTLGHTDILMIRSSDNALSLVSTVCAAVSVRLGLAIVGKF